MSVLNVSGTIPKTFPLQPSEGRDCSGLKLKLEDYSCPRQQQVPLRKTPQDSLAPSVRQVRERSVINGVNVMNGIGRPMNSLSCTSLKCAPTGPRCANQAWP